MDRRTYLVTAGAIIAGCTGSEEQPVEGGDHNDGSDGSGGGGQETAPDTETPEPTSTPAEEPTETETTTPKAEANVAIVGSELQKSETSIGTDAYAIARLTNDGNAPSGEIRVDGRFYDENENLIDDIIATLPYLKPGETWKVNLPFLGDGSKVDSHKIDGEFKQEPPVFDPDGVSIKDTEMEIGEYSTALHGVVQNDLTEDADYLAVHARFWVDDVVVAPGLDNITNVPAGENWAFEANYGGYSSGANWSKDVTDFDIYPEVNIY